MKASEEPLCSHHTILSILQTPGAASMEQWKMSLGSLGDSQANQLVLLVLNPEQSVQAFTSQQVWPNTVAKAPFWDSWFAKGKTWPYSSLLLQGYPGYVRSSTQGESFGEHMAQLKNSKLRVRRGSCNLGLGPNDLHDSGQFSPSFHFPLWKIKEPRQFILFNFFLIN